ncbi:Zn-ribbon domain-containing OB-fold protein [Pandoraea captiosa]|jgi:uncharacterized OB-fold protein
MWEAMRHGEIRLQRCRHCNRLRYPPAPICPNCLGEHAEWDTLRPFGTIISWVVFHRQYFDDFPPPHRCVAVRLDEGPIIVTTLAHDTPPRQLTGCRVALHVGEHVGRCQHFARLV